MCVAASCALSAATAALGWWPRRVRAANPLPPADDSPLRPDPVVLAAAAPVVLALAGSAVIAASRPQR